MIRYYIHESDEKERIWDMLFDKEGVKQVGRREIE